MTASPWAASEAGAVQALEAFMAALNAGDNQALYDTMHVPHVRISGIRRRSREIPRDVQFIR